MSKFELTGGGTPHSIPSEIKVLELFSGTECLSNAFRNRGYKCFTVDWDKKFPSDLHIDIEQLTADMILEKFGKPDVIWVGTDCTTFSIAAISHHRRKNPETGSLDPVSEYAKKCDSTNIHVKELIKELNPTIQIWENPRGGLRKMWYMQDLNRQTTTYCQYGFKYMKPTDFFSNIDLKLKPPCKNGAPCHERAPRGSKSGLQKIKGADLRSMYPKELCEHMVDVCEEYLYEYHLLDKCKDCVNKWSSQECEMCEEFDMYKENI